MDFDSADLTQKLIGLRDEEHPEALRRAVEALMRDLPGRASAGAQDPAGDGAQSVARTRADYIADDLRQIYEADTIERARYYLERLIKGLSETKTSAVNDINLNRWKEYDGILTDSLWVIDRRDSSGAHNAGYWGNFIPQIPHQLLLRYTKKGDWVLDTFLGSGTTLIECRRLGRNGIGIELQPGVAALAAANVDKEADPHPGETVAEIVTGDCLEVDYAVALGRHGRKTCQFVIMHPPYWDIIRFSGDPRDLSNASGLDGFLAKMNRLAEKVYEVLEEGRYCALVIGDKYSAGEWIPLGFLTMNVFLQRGFQLKSIIVKNFEDTKGKANRKELWRYRALAGGYYVFKHEYIFVFKKKGG